jgi:hypothetical protein
VKEIIMKSFHRTAAFGIGLVVFTASGFTVSRLFAQTAADPSGHWVGSIEIPGRTLDFQVDFAKDGAGQLAGAITVQSDDSDGFPFPLNRIAINGKSIEFYARSDSPLHGVLSDDGMTMSGTTTLSGYELSFGMRRTGDAQLAPAPASAAVSSNLEGSWNAALEVAGKLYHVVLTITNQPGGTAIARIIDLDEGGLVIPVVITQKASYVSYESRGVRTSYAGELNAAGTELAGVWTQGEISLPLSFQRAAR